MSKAKGAYVIGTASTSNRDFVKNLGADEFIDYTSTDFEDLVKDIDVVFDPIGGDTHKRSYQVLKIDGFLNFNEKLRCLAQIHPVSDHRF